MYFEILKNNKVIKRGEKILGDISFSNELMYIPTISLSLPIVYHEYLEGRVEIKIYINNKIFRGLVKSLDIDKDSEAISLSIEHIVSEWNYRQLPTNLAIENTSIKDLYDTSIFKYSDDWIIQYQGNVGEHSVNYVYSRQEKLDGLTKTLEMTSDLFWRVGFTGEKCIEVGTFGDKKPYRISTSPTTKRNIRIIKEPSITNDFSNVINIATVYSDKSDNGMSSMTLREIYDNPDLQKDGFPVCVSENIINNERQYNNYVSYPALAPNNELEYIVVDEESIAIEGGALLEGSYTFDDLSPFSLDGKDITDQDRIEASKGAYETAIKRLKNARREYSISVIVEEIPKDINVGDRIRFSYDNTLLLLGECSNYLKKILTLDDWYYITAIDYSIDAIGIEVNTLKLEKFLKIDRESKQ